MASGWSYPLSHWNWWTEGKPVGSNSGTLWSILLDKSLLLQLHPEHKGSLAHPCRQQLPRALPARRPWLVPGRLGGDRLLPGTGSVRLLSHSAWCSAASWSPLLTLTQTWERKTCQGTGNFSVWAERMWRLSLRSSSSENSARRERIETVEEQWGPKYLTIYSTVKSKRQNSRYLPALSTAGAHGEPKLGV